jgi:D-alanyl-D-alanine carboxypeptidase (penicillin-binding protein 5/6)
MAWKTAHTETAGYCLAASAIRDGMRLISGDGIESKTCAPGNLGLMNYGFRFYETVVV